MHPLFSLMRIVILIVIAVFCFATGCGDSLPEDESAGVESVTTLDSIFLGDSIGVLMGDSCYVFGAIRDIVCVPEGIAVLDAIFCRISLFSPDGEFLYSGGRSGEGPGEFSNPTRYCRLSTGDWFVSDYVARRITILDDSLNYVTSYNSQWGLPIRVVAADDSMIVMKQLVMEFRDEKLFAGYQIASMNAYTGQENVVYREHLVEMGADVVDIRDDYCFFTADNQGNVYLADYDSDRYCIDVFSAQGDTLRTLEMETEIRDEFDIDIHRLIFLPITIPYTTSSGTSTMKITAPDLHPYVTFLDVDGDNNIWVRRMGLPDSEYWDVISAEGELLRKVVLCSDTTESASYPTLHVSSNGFVATRIENEVERFYIVR